jgi:tetratricopeptide (TPR) repeat protein
MNWQQQMQSADKAIQQGNLPTAEYLLWEALKLAEGFGPQSSQVTDTAARLGDVLMRQAKYPEAEDLLLRLAEMLGNSLGPMSVTTAATLLKIAELYYAQTKYSTAEPFAVRALGSYESIYGKDHEETARIAGNVAYIFHAQGKFVEAEDLYKRALYSKTKKNKYDRESLSVLRSYATLLEATHRAEEAKHLLRCAEGLESGNWQVYNAEPGSLT